MVELERVCHRAPCRILGSELAPARTTRDSGIPRRNLLAGVAGAATLAIASLRSSIARADTNGLKALRV